MVPGPQKRSREGVNQQNRTYSSLASEASVLAASAGAWPASSTALCAGIVVDTLMTTKGLIGVNPLVAAGGHRQDQRTSVHHEFQDWWGTSPAKSLEGTSGVLPSSSSLTTTLSILKNKWASVFLITPCCENQCVHLPAMTAACLLSLGSMT